MTARMDAARDKLRDLAKCAAVATLIFAGLVAAALIVFPRPATSTAGHATVGSSADAPAQARPETFRGYLEEGLRDLGQWYIRVGKALAIVIVLAIALLIWCAFLYLPIIATVVLGAIVSRR